MDLEMCFTKLRNRKTVFLAAEKKIDLIRPVSGETPLFADIFLFCCEDPTLCLIRCTTNIGGRIVPLTLALNKHPRPYPNL